MTVNATARQLNVNASLLSQTGSYNLKVFGSYWDGVLPYKSSAQTFTVVVFCAETISVIPATVIASPHTYSIGTTQQLIPLP